MKEINEIVIHLRNCFDDVCELKINLDNVRYIFKQTLSSDEIAIVVYKDNSSAVFDSDMHGRCTDYDEGLEMIYPEQIDLCGCYYNPDEHKDFVMIKKGENK